jgi:hypothetical protein
MTGMLKRLLAVFALVCCFGVAIQGQDIEKAKALLQQALAALEPAPATPNGPTVFHVATSVELLAARDASKPGDEIRAKVGPASSTAP